MRPGQRRLISALLTAGSLLIAHPATGAENFRFTDVRNQQDSGDPSHILVQGTVVNTDRRTVLDVYVTAEALDATGHVVATGIAYVTSAIEGSNGAPFVVAVRRVKGITDFRLTVTSFRYGLRPQGP